MYHKLDDNFSNYKECFHIQVIFKKGRNLAANIIELHQSRTIQQSFTFTLRNRNLSSVNKISTFLHGRVLNFLQLNNPFLFLLHIVWKHRTKVIRSCTHHISINVELLSFSTDDEDTILSLSSHGVKSLQNSHRMLNSIDIKRMVLGWGRLSTWSILTNGMKQ